MHFVAGSDRGVVVGGPQIWLSLYMISFVQVYSFYWACWTSMKLLVILDSSLVVIITNKSMNAEHRQP